jgi:DNA-directed RNA polymerase subunit F
MKKLEVELTLEQQFQLNVYAEKLKLISGEQARILVVEMLRQNMMKDNAIKNLLNPNPNE